MTADDVVARPIFVHQFEKHLLDTRAFLIDGIVKRIYQVVHALLDFLLICKTEDEGNGDENDDENDGTQNQGGSSTSSETAENFALTITTSGSGSASVTINGNAVTSGASLNEDDEVAISITPAEGQVPTATINGSSIELTESDGVYSGNFAMPAQASTLVINTGTTSSGSNGSDGLDMGG